MAGDKGNSVLSGLWSAEERFLLDERTELRAERELSSEFNRNVNGISV